MVRVFLVDDHEVVRRGIARLLQSDDLQIVGEAGTATEALARIPEAHPDVAILDVRLPDGDGVGLCRKLRAQSPEVRCLMLTAFGDDDTLVGAVAAGASGFMHKFGRATDLVAAVRTVGAGGSVLDSDSTAAIMRHIRRDRHETVQLQGLTRRERSVLELIAAGLTNRQIAERLFLTENTVKNYVSHVLAKLGMEHRAEAAVLATKWQTMR